MTMTNLLTYQVSFIISLLLCCQIIGLIMYSFGVLRARNNLSFFIKTIAGQAIIITIYLNHIYPFLFHHQLYSHLQSSWPFLPSFNAFFNLKHVNIANHELPYVLIHVLSLCLIPTIIAGITAERLKLWPFLLFMLLYAVFVIPLIAFWLHSHSLFSRLGFIDQNHCSLIFIASVAAGISASYFLKPRQHKYNSDGEALPILGSNLSLSAIGVLFFIIGSIGFNATYLIGQPLNIIMPSLLAISLNTLIAVFAAALICIICTQLGFGKIDIGFLYLAMLAAAITPAAHPLVDLHVTNAINGAVAGLFTIIASLVLDRLRLDDPTGAISFLGIGSCWSLIMASINHAKNIAFLPYLHQLGIQLAVGFILFFIVLLLSLFLWWLVNLLICLRINPRTEIHGLDQKICSTKAYPEFHHHYTTETTVE